MKYDIIFYHSGKTAEAERLLERRLLPLGCERERTAAAITPQELGRLLGASVKSSRLVFIIGGLDGGKQSTDSVLSVILSSKDGQIRAEKLVDDNDGLCYLIRSREQTIVVFQDDPEIIEFMLENRVLDELKEVYSISGEESGLPSFESVAGELRTQLSGMKMSRPAPLNEAVKREEKALKIMRAAIIALIAVGASLIAAAVILFFK